VRAFLGHEWSYDDFHKNAGRIYFVRLTARPGYVLNTILVRLRPRNVGQTIAIVPAGPLAYWLSELFLGRHNRTETDVVSYAMGAGIAPALTWLVSGYHTVPAARVNPVDSPRCE
jgi:hypothetical protein